MGDFHQPVLLQSVCALLEIRPGKHYLDTTLGGGGHAKAIIDLGGDVLGLDQDPDALSACPDLDHLIKVRSNFIHLKEVVEKHHWQPLEGVIFDLGVSSYQLKMPNRGFSFQITGPLDMRMDPTTAITAADLVNDLPPKALSKILEDFGEISPGAAIVNRIIQNRPLITTQDLASLVPDFDLRRRVFQALRIAVNDELGALESALPQALSVISPGGKIVVISFHSLEDRIVKNYFSNWSKQELGEILTKKPIIPDKKEMTANPKSKSAKLRAFQKKYVQK
jgi:16S rRNA (cytosine1402-N4)-methyltransferase